MKELPAPDQITIGQVFDLYLAMGTKELAANTLELAKLALREFREQFAERRVVDLRAVELVAYMQANESRWPSAWTRLGRIACIKRALNWAWDLGLLNGNPFLRVKVTGTRTRRRPMTDDQYQAILRNSPPHWRRFVVFLRFSGARTKEAAQLRWNQINLAKAVAVQVDHKTAKKTGKPRLIPLSPVVVKLLVWMKQHRQARVVSLLAKFLESGPKRGKEVVAFMRHHGASDRATHGARLALRVEKIRVGGTGPKGYYQYRLPKDYRPPADPTMSDFVFMSCEGNPLNKSSMGLFMRRLRRRVPGLHGVTLYMLRHAYGTRGIANGVPIKLVSLAMGHASVDTTEIYIDETTLGDEVADAVVQINHGPGARMTTAAPRPEPPPRIVEMPTYGVPIGEMNTKAIVLPSRNGDAPRPVVPLTPPDAPPATSQTAETLVHLLMQKLSEVESMKKRPRPSVPVDSLTPAQHSAWAAYEWALEQQPALATATDPQLFAWLKARPDCPHPLPPLVDTFGRYLRVARSLFDCRKRVLGEGGSP